MFQDCSRPMNLHEFTGFFTASSSSFNYKLSFYNCVVNLFHLSSIDFAGTLMWRARWRARGVRRKKTRKCERERRGRVFPEFSDLFTTASYGSHALQRNRHYGPIWVYITVWHSFLSAGDFWNASIIWNASTTWKRFPKINFLSMIVGVQGINHKRMQEESGCRIVWLREWLRCFCWWQYCAPWSDSATQAHGMACVAESDPGSADAISVSDRCQYLL